jgi:hypothetical protein
MRTGLFTASGLLLAAMASGLPAQTASPRVFSPRESENAPQIDLWLDQVSYNIGDRIAPHFQSEAGAYVTIVRVTSDGEVRVLYPQEPRDQRQFEPAQLVNDRVPYSSLDRRFEVYESQGMGFVFAIASFSKFNYSYFTSGGDWSLNHLSSIRYGDPFEIVRRFADRTLGDGSDFSMDYVSYQVYNDAPQSRYATRYAYNTYDDYYNSCLSAFGYGYTLYCQPYYQDYPIVILTGPRGPRTNIPSDRHYAGKHIRPRVGDPLVHGAPSEPQPVAEGRLPNNTSASEAAAASRRERLLKTATPRDRGAPNVDSRAVDAAPRIYTAPERTTPDRPRYEPQRAAPAPRSEPERVAPPVRSEPPRIEMRPEPPRAQPAPPPPRVEVRNEPPPAPRIEVVRPAPTPPPAPAKKDN